MSLPSYYTNDSPSSSRQYFEDAIKFFNDYKWIYNFANTDVLIHDIFQQFPKNWLETLQNLTVDQLNAIPNGVYQESFPESLIAFIKTVQQLKPAYKIEPNDRAELRDTHGLSPKKQQEITHLAGYIARKCRARNITTIVDVGAGRGYIGYTLNENYGFKILGIEGDAIKYESALRLQRKYHAKTIDHVRFFHHYVDGESGAVINRALIDCFAEGNTTFDENVCLIGLHACADLTIVALKLFMSLTFCKSIVIMPCCYHKMSVKTQSCDGELFDNFPVSRMFTDVYQVNGACAYLKREFLRVACQSSARVWEEMTQHEYDQHNVSHLRRAIIQKYAHDKNFQLVKLKRKCMNRTTSSDCDFSVYLNRLACGFYLRPINDGVVNERIEKDYDSRMTESDVKFTDESVRKALMEYWHRYRPLTRPIQALTCLQNAIQSICENVILYDRVCFLNDNHVACQVEKIICDTISPRCHAIFAVKSNKKAISYISSIISSALGFIF